LKAKIQVSKHNFDIVFPNIIELSMWSSLGFEWIGQNIAKLLKSPIRSFNTLTMIQMAIQKAKWSVTDFESNWDRALIPCDSLVARGDGYVEDSCCNALFS